MSKKQPTQEELLDKVLVGNFSADTQSNLIPQDGDTLILHPSQILKYDRNPRIVRNREYESIKRQLMSQGVQEVLSVTQRPGMPPDQFMLARGANTRLEIIHEILEETSDERFLQIKCRYVVWVSEAKIFTDTMAENDVRGEVTFFDRAHATMDLKAILEEQSGNPYGPRELIEYINSHGLSKVNRADIARFKYTYGHLQEALLQSLSLGLGPRQVDAISKLHEAASMLWEDAGETDDWDPLFQGILKKLDQRIETLDDWSYDRLFKEVARELGGNDTQAIERAKAGLEFVLETGQLPEKREYKPFKATDNTGTGEAEPPQTPTKPNKPKSSSVSKPSSPSKPKVEPPKAPEQTPASGGGQGFPLILEEMEEDPDDRPEYFADDPLMQIANTELEDDEALRGLVPDEDLIVDEEGNTHYRPKFPVLTDEQMEANTRANLEDWRRFKAENPDKTELTPEQKDLMRRREEWLASLQRDREESGRTRSTNMLVERAIVNLRPFPTERLHHDAYASGRRICREFFGLEMADQLVRPLTRGVGFYVADWPKEFPFEKHPTLATLQLTAWHWLVVASGQTKITEMDLLPDEILASPFGEIIRDVFDLDNFDGGDLLFHRISNAIAKRVPIEPSMLMLHDLMLHAPLNISLEQMIINRANYELNRRCVEKFDTSNLFLLESNWDRQYGDQTLDSLNRFE